MSQVPSDITNNAWIITSDGQFRVRLTDDDVLWAARSCAGETLSASHSKATATDAADVLWTLTQRYIRWLVLDKNISFIDSTRGFSQPVNPIWLDPNGKKCRASPDRCKPDTIKRRRFLHSASWGDLLKDDERRGTNVVYYTRLWAAGRLNNTVPNVTNFATPKVSRGHMQKSPKSEVRFKRGGHWYISDPPATRWPLDYVLMESPDGVYTTGVAHRDKVALQTVSAAREFWDTVTLQSFWDWG
jgi:hypothetical protein